MSIIILAHILKKKERYTNNFVTLCWIICFSQNTTTFVKEINYEKITIFQYQKFAFSLNCMDWHEWFYDDAVLRKAKTRIRKWGVSISDFNIY